jgi:hypothetical protein
MMIARRSLTPLLLLAAACAAPGTDIVPQPADFAVVQIELLG